ncbi:sulfur carrier protein ThiS [Desulfofundulus thermobenzoicus]|uniref:Sulfur carrier protein ThiS n=1 Tax=Desulfofundulus thermobenzoicus TaxID=29376 RepID=A0A6N7IUN2_9FIRM|nr:sulfur carrier protein ThiS [Desulfofundulus thermobenzoicus]MQL53790.1 sulfur carrier protein ThiS [Desulfofundulus thermobenzoicus]HHW42463.1 sulfur carrier protein ThiS [Desulfotomaculum sp.]
MLVVINGKKTELPDEITLADMLTQRKLNPETVLIEYNGELVPKELWPGVVLNDGDRLEILRFVGGG